MYNNNQPREIDFSPNQSNFSGVTDLSSIFDLDGGEKTPKLEDHFEISDEIKEIKDKEKKQDLLTDSIVGDSVEDTEDAFDQLDQVEEVNPEDVILNSNEGDPSDEIDVLEHKDSTYRDIAKDLFGDTFDSVIIEEDGKEVEVGLDELELDKDALVDLIKSRIDEVKEEAVANKISTDDISDLTKSIINIDKNGGDIKEALSVYETYKDPVKDLDLTLEEDQIKAIVYAERLQNTSDERIKKKIEFYGFEGSIEDEALKAKESLDKEAEQRLKAIEENAIKQKEFEVKALKQYRSDLSKSLEEFNLKPSFKKKLLDISSKKGENGGFELDDIYSKVRANPKESAELILFLTDKEEYLKQIMKSKLTEKQVEVQKQLKFARRNRESSTFKKTKSGDRKDFIDIEDLPR